MLMSLFKSTNITIVNSSEISNLAHSIVKYSPADIFWVIDELNGESRLPIFEG